MMTEKRKNIIRKMLPAIRNKVSGVSGIPARDVIYSSTGRARERISIATAASSQLPEYSTRMCARRTETSTKISRITLRTVVTFRRRSISVSSSVTGGPRRPVHGAIVLQNIDEDAQQHVED